MARTPFKRITNVDVRNSKLWEIYIPLAAAVIPSGLFILLGLVTKDFAQPDAKIPFRVVMLMITLQITGITAMAWVILMRLDAAYERLSLSTTGRPAPWRRLAVQLSIGCLLLFDVLTYFATAFAGAAPLLLIAIPAFLAYLIIGRTALLGTNRKPPLK